MSATAAPERAAGPSQAGPPQAGTPAAPAPPGPSLRTSARRARGPLILVGALLLVALATALTEGGGLGTLDTTSVSPTGTHALATLLRGQGVAVRQVRTVAAAEATTGGTLVVAGADLLTADAARRVAASGATTVVLVGATTDGVVDTFAPGTRAVGTTGVGVHDPACALRAAVLAGSADSGGAAYTPPGASAGGDAATGCYPVAGGPSLLVQRVGGREVVLLGTASPLLNEHLGADGNAALALNLLGGDGGVTWYLPSLEDLYGPGGGPGGQRSVLDLVPDGVLGALAWLGVVVLLLAAWRARRFGPVVVEPLPVVVRASENVEGRARLYRRGGARGRAAELLRAAERDRLSPVLGLPPAPPGGSSDAARALVDAVAGRSARTTEEVAALLYGAAPSDDAALVRLADELDRLDREVRRP